MASRKLASFFWSACFWVLLASAPRAEEPPLLAARIAAGQLPAMAERLPLSPRRDLPSWEGWQEGGYGGELVTLTRGGRDARDLFLLGYARLLVWNESLELVPDILQSVEVEEGRRFTLNLREGHRWSDGHPFTSEDFRFWWEDVATDRELSPTGPPAEMIAGGEAPEVEILSPTQVRYSWPVPNARFLPVLAGSDALLIYRPAHALKRYHRRYSDPAELQQRADEEGLRDWSALFNRRDRLFEMDDPNLPTLQPWKVSSASGNERWIGERNPFFHRIDLAGRQLPYIDRVVIDRTQAQLIPAKVMAGESGLQARGLSFRDAALLKQAERRGATRLLLWPSGRGAQMALYPNLNAADPSWQALLRQADFRRALSLALDREEINQVIFQGFGIGGNNSVLPESPLFRADWRDAWARHDPAGANALLDALGLEPGDDGFRRFPDGRELLLVIETGDSDPAETDALELVASQLAKVGIKVAARPTARQNFRARIQSGEAVLSLFYGLANGIAAPDNSPAELAPTQDRQNNWPSWGRHFQTAGREGEEPDLPEARRLLELYRQWSESATRAERRAVWEEMLAIHADQVFTIGLVAGVPQPVAVDPRLRNLPAAAAYLYEPGAYFGRFRADTWWFEGG